MGVSAKKFKEKPPVYLRSIYFEIFATHYVDLNQFQKLGSQEREDLKL